MRHSCSADGRALKLRRGKASVDSDAACHGCGSTEWSSRGRMRGVCSAARVDPHGGVVRMIERSLWKHGGGGDRRKLLICGPGAEKILHLIATVMFLSALNC
jgi:hypothetical protein